jgi:hypothetical protein
VVVVEFASRSRAWASLLFFSSWARCTISSGDGGRGPCANSKKKESKYILVYTYKYISIILKKLLVLISSSSSFKKKKKSRHSKSAYAVALRSTGGGRGEGVFHLSYYEKCKVSFIEIERERPLLDILRIGITPLLG